MTGEPDIERAVVAEREVEAAQKSGKKLGVEILSTFANLFSGLAAHYQPWPAAMGMNPHADIEEFARWAGMAVRAASLVAAYETARPAAERPPEIVFQPHVSVSTTVVAGAAPANFDYGKLSTEQLTAYYRARVAGGSHDEVVAGLIPVDPAHRLPGPDAAPVPPPPEAVITRAPLELDEPTETLVGVEPEVVARSSKDEKVVPLLKLHVIPARQEDQAG